MTKTGTFEEIYDLLSHTEKQSIVDEVMQHLEERRKGDLSLYLRGLHYQGFRLPSYIRGPGQERQSGPIEACHSSEAIWDRVWKPRLQANNVSHDEVEFLRRTMPQDDIFIYAQMDLSSANIMVQNGHFSGFASEDLAGYFPPWFQNVAIATLHHITDNPEAGRADAAIYGSVVWELTLAAWLHNPDNRSKPLADSIWYINPIHLPEMDYGRMWFEYWYLLSKPPSHPDDPNSVQDSILLRHRRNGIAAVTDYLMKKTRPEDRGMTDFANYMKEKRTQLDGEEGKLY